MSTAAAKFEVGDQVEDREGDTGMIIGRSRLEDGTFSYFVDPGSGRWWWYREHQLEFSCVCDASGRDEFGNRDQVVNPNCPTCA